MSAPQEPTTAASHRPDDGLSLVELLTTMVVLGLLMVAFSSAVLATTRGIRNVQGMNTIAADARAASDRLGRLIPYAVQANTPTQVGNDWYLELLTDRAGSASTCTQLRVRSAAGLLEQRTWEPGKYAGVRPWTTVARDVAVDPSGPDPFVGYPKDPSFVSGRIGVNLTFTSAGATQRSNILYALRYSEGREPLGVDLVCMDGARA